MSNCEHVCESCKEHRNSADGAVADFIAYEANRRELAEWIGVSGSDVQIRFAKQTDSFGEVMDRAEGKGSVVAVMDGGQLMFYRLHFMRVQRKVSNG
jgi:hypothetical protein